MNKTILLSGIFFGVLAVILGAFGAHGLKGLIPAEALESYETGVDYQMYHALLLMVLSGLPQPSAQTKKWVFLMLVAGIVFFSFSIYALALRSLWGLDLSMLGPLTPLGGVFLISAWILLAYRIFKPLN